MLKTTKYLLPLLGIFLLSVLVTSCMKDEVVDPCIQHEDPTYRNSDPGGEEGSGGEGGGISDGGDEESDSERNTKQTGPRP